MNKNPLFVTDKELFYAAMMLHFGRLVNFEYDFPADEAALEMELGEAKSSLQRKKLLRESAAGEVVLDFVLFACAAFCSHPEACAVVESGEYHAAVYSAAGLHMLMERRDGGNAVVWFREQRTLDQYLADRAPGSAKGGTKRDGK